MVIVDVKRELLKRSLLQENRGFALGVEDGYRAPVSASYLMMKCLWWLVVFVSLARLGSQLFGQTVV